ncbi:MAG: hypothetical protein N3A66_01285 [Planctomycetota bacterium]|nr:hypothetical protein [Planctomycetota bacterium]
MTKFTAPTPRGEKSLPRRFIWPALFCWAVAFAFFAAEDGDEAVKQTIIGAVEARSAEGGKPEAFLVSGDGEIYHIVMDEKGRRLAAECQGKMVTVVGAVRVEGEGDEAVRWLAVESWQVIPEEENNSFLCGATLSWLTAGR